MRIVEGFEKFLKFGPRGSKKNQNIMLGVGLFGIVFGVVQLRYAFQLKKNLENQSNPQGKLDGTYVDTKE